MIWVVKLIEIGCWSSGRPRQLLANCLTPNEKQITKVTIRVGSTSCDEFWTSHENNNLQKIIFLILNHSKHDVIQP